MKRKYGRKKWHHPKRLLLFTLVTSGIILLFSWRCYAIVADSASGKMYSSTDTIPERDVGLVLGTSKYMRNGYFNPYFTYRLDAAVKLFEAGKVHHLIVSGDNSTKNYDEPTDMMNYLIDNGIPANCITRDYAGFRTFDSMVRAMKVFGQQKITVISQRFHNERALFICNHIGLDAIAFNARDPYRGSGSRLREYLARTKAVLDVYLGKQPKFLGEQIAIHIQK